MKHIIIQSPRTTFDKYVHQNVTNVTMLASYIFFIKLSDIKGCLLGLGRENMHPKAYASVLPIIWTIRHMHRLLHFSTKS